MATTFPTPMSAAPAPGGGGGGGGGGRIGIIGRRTSGNGPFAPGGVVGGGGGDGGGGTPPSSNGRSPPASASGDDYALSSLQTLWGMTTTTAEIGGGGGGGGGSDVARDAAPSKLGSGSGNGDQLRPERSVLRRTPSVRCAVDAYATRVLRSTSPPEMRDAVDDSLGPYITSLLRDIVGDDGEAMTISMMEPPPQLTGLDEYDNLIELVVEHCAVTTPGGATEALEAIYDAVCTGRIPPASPPAGGDGDNGVGAETSKRKSLLESSLADMSSFRAATLDPWSTGSAAEGELRQQQPELQTENAEDKPLTQVTPDGVDEDLEKLVGRMVFTDEEEEDGGANRLASDLLAVMDESSFAIPKKSNADIESTTTTSSTEEGAGTPAHQALHTIAADDVVNMNAELAAAAAIRSAAPGGRNDSDSPSGEKQQINRDGGGKKKNRSSVNNDSEAKDLAAALFRPARPRSNSNLSDGNKRKSPTFGGGSGCAAAGAGVGAHAYPPYPLPPSSSPPPTYPTAPPPVGVSATSATAATYSNYQQYYDHGTPSDAAPSSSSILPPQQDRRQQQHPLGEDNLQLFHLASEQLLTYNPDLSPEAAWEASMLSGGDVQLAYQVIDRAANATPVCRHMLSHACYRSDCQFSHDVEGHTCAFWLRGRCGKGGECRFLHGFHERALQGATSAAAAVVSGKPPQPPPRPRPGPQSFPSNPSTSHTLTGGGGGVGVGGIDTDRQRHLLGSEFLDGTLSDWDNDGPVPGPGGSGGNRNTTSFASIASKGGPAIGPAPDSSPAAAFAPTGNTFDSSTRRGDRRSVSTVKIPQHLWNASINRNPELFYVEDPVERYYAVNGPASRTGGGNGDDVVMDLHFQSEKTAPIVLAALLPEKLRRRGTAPPRSDYDNGSTQPRGGVWIVTGSGHHVNERSHQRGGGVLENAVMDWLDENEFEYYRGKDRNGYGGAILVVR